MKPLAPLETSLFLKTSASSSGDLAPLLADDPEVYGLANNIPENSL